MWVKPDHEYAVVNVDKEEWIVSKYAVIKLRDQLKKVDVKGKIYGKDLIGKKVVNPVTKKKVPILAADFVDPENTTGIVMSVPSHAPYDYVALRDLKSKIKPISIIETSQVFGEHPAIEIVEKMGIKDQNDPKLEAATKEVYRKEFYGGVLKKAAGKYAGLKVSEAKEKLSKEFIKKGYADLMWETTGKVVCRCTARNHIKIVENQWFLLYSNEDWKSKAKECLNNMIIFPESARQNFLNTIDWLKDKACTRQSGLGTPLPWDNKWIVETLSDSTIYMAYYTIAHLIKDFKPEELTPAVFDYIFRNKGSIKDQRIEKLKEEFDYWYPLDMRCSGKDLIQNHLTFFIFHHSALFPKNKWPKGIGVNGFVNVEGEKMSKSKGNIIPLRNLLQEYGADLVRINIGASSEGLEDADWRTENINTYKARMDFIKTLIEDLKEYKNEKKTVDKYLISKLQHSILNATKHYEKMNYRSVVNETFFKIINEIKWYLERGGNNKEVLKETIETLLKLIAPIVPHFAEEMWELLGNKPFISITDKWPEYDEKKINISIEASEDILKNTITDIEEIKKLSKIEKPNKITIFVAPSWKYDVYKSYYEKKPLKEVLADPKLKKFKKEVSDYYIKLQKRKKVGELNLTSTIERSMFEDSKDFLEKQLNTKIEIMAAEKSTHPKATLAEPLKPGILIE